MSRALFFSVARACTDGKNPAVSGEKKKKGVAVLDSLSLSYVVRCNPLFFLCNALYIPPFLPVKKRERGRERANLAENMLQIRFSPSFLARHGAPSLRTDKSNDNNALKDPRHTVPPETDNLPATKGLQCSDVFERVRAAPILKPLPPAGVPLAGKLLVAYHHMIGHALDRVHDALIYSPTYNGPRALYAAWTLNYEGQHVQRWTPALARVRSLLQCIFEPHVVSAHVHPWLAARGALVWQLLLCMMQPLAEVDLDMWNAAGSERAFWQFWIVCCWCIERMLVPRPDASPSLAVCPSLWTHWNASVEAFANLPSTLLAMQRSTILSRMDDYPACPDCYETDLPGWLSGTSDVTISVPARSGDLLLSMMHYAWARPIEYAILHTADWEWFLETVPWSQNPIVCKAMLPSQETWLAEHACTAKRLQCWNYYGLGSDDPWLHSDDSDSSSSSDSDSD